MTPIETLLIACADLIRRADIMATHTEGNPDAVEDVEEYAKARRALVDAMREMRT